MNVLGDFEIIRTSLLMGDIRDVMWKIRSVRGQADAAFHTTGKKKFSLYAEFLGLLSSVLSGDSPLSALRSAMKSGDYAILFEGTEAERYADTFIFFLEYAIDRYNVNFPEYDEKRCSDV